MARDRAWLVIAAYLMLVIVMGGRTALFVSTFDDLIVMDVFGADITLLSVLLAVALVVAVAGSAWWRAHFGRNHRGYRTATWTLVGAVALDGMFNVSEAILLAQESGRLDDQPFPLDVWMWLSVVMIGVGPTLLTVGLASLAGTVDRSSIRATSKRTSTSVAIAIRRTVDENPALDAHLTTIERRLSPGQTFTRSEVEQWTRLGKAQAINVINYGKARGVLDDESRGVYVYREAGE